MRVKSIATRLWKTSGLKRVAERLGLSELWTDRLAPSTVTRIRRSQINTAIRQTRVLYIATTFVAPAMAYQAWDKGINATLVLWTATIVGLSWQLLYAWHKSPVTEGRTSDMRRFEWQTIVSALLWGVGIVIVYPLVDSDGKTVVAAIMAGTLALGTIGFSHTPRVAVSVLMVQSAFSIYATLGSAVATGSLTDYVLTLLMIVATIGVFGAVVDRGRSAVRAFLDHEHLAEKSEVIDLLLKDYEEQANDWLWQTDQDGKILSAPKHILALLEIEDTPLGSVNLIDTLVAQATQHCAADLARLTDAVQHHHEFHDIKLSLRGTDDRRLRWLSIRGRPQYAETEFIGYRGLFADATAAVEASQKVEYLANHDGLTGLMNRNSVQQQLGQLRAEADCVSSILIDLDGFKQVNDTYGHGIGDILLKDVANRLRAELSDTHEIARMGGDEFFVLLRHDGTRDMQAVLDLCKHLVATLSKPYLIEHFEISVSASIGIARFPEDATNGKDLLLHSDLALYASKNGGRNQYRCFDPTMETAMQRRLLVTERLKQALQSETVAPHYQPQYSLFDGRLVGFEALARWTDSHLGVIGPDVFVPIAEQTGLIVELGEQLLRRACLDALTWEGPWNAGAAPLVSVNMSPVQFSRVDVCDLVTRVLTETGLPPERLEIEITESVLITDTEKVAAKLRTLAELGVKVALDDFGTGYSSLSYLKSLPLNRLKIDRSFISDLHEPAAQPIVNTIIQLGKNLGLSVLAEGVETQVQMSVLSRMGCHDAQGYFYSRPLPADDILAQIMGGRPRSRSAS